jgi:hypothetical protein
MSFLEDRKGQLLTLDLLLALVPLTIFLGISASALGGVVHQIQEYSFFYSMQRQTADAADVLVKTPGVPQDWNATNPPTVPGLAVYSCNRASPNFLEYDKLTALDETMISQLVSNGTNVYFEAVDLLTNTTIKAVTYNTTGIPIEAAANVFAVKRVVSIDENNTYSLLKEYTATSIRSDTITWSFELPCGFDIKNLTILITTGSISGSEYVRFRMDNPPDPSLPSSDRQYLFIGENMVNFSWDDAYNDPTWTQWQDARNYVSQQGNNHSRYPEKTIDSYLRENLVAGPNTVEISLRFYQGNSRGDVSAFLNVTYGSPTPREGLVTMKIWR